MEKGKRQGARRGEYCARSSRQARLRTGNERIKISADGPSGRLHRRPPAVLPPPPFPFVPKVQSHWQTFHRAAPPEKGGRMLARTHARNTAPIVTDPSSRTTEIPGEPESGATCVRTFPATTFGMNGSGGQGLPALPFPALGKSQGFRRAIPWRMLQPAFIPPDSSHPHPGIPKLPSIPPPPPTKKAAPFGTAFAYRFSGDYLRSLRRRTIARAPRPSRLIVAGSGTAEASVVNLAL